MANYKDFEIDVVTKATYDAKVYAEMWMNCSLKKCV